MIKDSQLRGIPERNVGTTHEMGGFITYEALQSEPESVVLLPI